MQDEIAEATKSVGGFLADFPTPILPKIDREPTIKGLIDIYKLISGNAASMASNLGRGQHGHFALTMTAEDYMEQTGFTFFPPHNPGNYPESIWSAQEQALVTETFQ